MAFNLPRSFNNTSATSKGCGRSYNLMFGCSRRNATRSMFLFSNLNLDYDPYFE